MSTQDQDEIQKKQLAHYSAAVAAWFNTRLEHDKSLLTLSSAAIGLLITVVSKAVGTKTDLVLYESALCAFILCLITVLWIYRQNSKHLEEVVQNQAPDDAVLGLLDATAIWAFGAGILLSGWLGIRLANHF